MAKTFDNISEASTTTCLFLFSQRTLALQNEPPTPPPLNALGMPCEVACRLWEWRYHPKNKYLSIYLLGPVAAAEKAAAEKALEEAKTEADADADAAAAAVAEAEAEAAVFLLSQPSSPPPSPPPFDEVDYFTASVAAALSSARPALSKHRTELEINAVNAEELKEGLKAAAKLKAAAASMAAGKKRLVSSEEVSMQTSAIEVAVASVEVEAAAAEPTATAEAEATAMAKEAKGEAARAEEKEKAEPEEMAAAAVPAAAAAAAAEAKAKAAAAAGLAVTKTLANQITEYIVDHQDDAAQEDHWRTTMKRDMSRSFKKVKEEVQAVKAEVKAEVQKVEAELQRQRDAIHEVHSKLDETIQLVRNLG